MAGKKQEIIINGIMEQAHVRVKVPVESENMRPVVKRKAYDSSDLKHFWQGTLRFGLGEVAVDFYGLRKDDLGRNITAMVQVSEITDYGKKSLRLYVFKTGGQALYRLKFPQWQEGTAVPISDCGHYVCFVPINGTKSLIAQTRPASRLKQEAEAPAEMVKVYMPFPPSDLGLTRWQRFVRWLRTSYARSRGEVVLGD